MALSQKYLQQWTESFVDLILAYVLRAVSGIQINILGTNLKPFTFLEDWADDLTQTAVDAYTNAATAQSTADTAQTTADSAQTTADTAISQIDSIQTTLEDISALRATPAYVADINDMATCPRSALVTYSTASVDNVASSTGSADGSAGSHSHSISGGSHNHSVSAILPVYTPDRYVNVIGVYASKVDYTPIVVDRSGTLGKLRWIVGADSSIFDIDGYYMGLCAYNPDNGNIEKLWDSGDLKDTTADTSVLAEVELDMGLSQECTPGQVLFVAHLQIAPGALQTPRSFACQLQAGVGRPSSLLLDASTYRTPDRYEAIPSSVALSSLTRINTRIPWAAVSVDTSGGGS